MRFYFNLPNLSRQSMFANITRTDKKYLVRHPLTASFKPLPGRKAGTLAAAILSSFPV